MNTDIILKEIGNKLLNNIENKIDLSEYENMSDDELLELYKEVPESIKKLSDKEVSEGLKLLQKESDGLSPDEKNRLNEILSKVEGD